jgi:hypothetical protein
VRTWGIGRGTFGGTLYLPIRSQVEDRGIPIMYQTPTKELIRNYEGEIIGVMDQPPYVALKLYPVMYNTQDRPRRNALCQVLNPFDNAIPRLYISGELGSFWGWIYNGGWNNSECLATGSIAGANAASLA